MWIKECYVENYGTLHKYHVQFQEGLNCIKEENGWGKSTFAAFIRGMFYGMDAGKRKNLDDTERKKYFPWQGGAFGGSLIFQTGAKTYRLERFFGKREKEDTFSLTDMATGLESRDYTENIGEELFGLNREAYSRSTYIPQNMTQVISNDSLNAKLGSQTHTNPENDINCYGKAMELLDEGRKIYKKNGGKGKINAVKLEKARLSQELAECKSKEAENEEWNYKLQEERLKEEGLKKKLLEIKKTIAVSGGKEAQKVRMEELQRMHHRLAELEEKIKEYDEFFAKGIPEEGELKNSRDSLRKLEGKTEKLAAYELSKEEELELEGLEQRFCNYKPSEKEIQQQMHGLSELGKLEKKLVQQEGDNPAVGAGKLWITGLLALAGLVLIPITGGISLILVLLGGILYVIWRNKEKKGREEKTRITGLAIEENRKEIEKFFKKCGLKFPMGEEGFLVLSDLKGELARWEQLKKRKEDRLIINTQRDMLAEELNIFFRQYQPEQNASPAEKLREIEEKRGTYIRLGEEALVSRERIAEYRGQLHPEEQKEEIPELKDLQAEEGKIENELEKVRLCAEKIRHRMTQLEQDTNRIPDLESETAGLQEEMEDGIRRLEIIEKTKTLMEEAKNRYTSHYLGKIISGFQKYLKLIAGESMTAFQIDVGLNVTFEEKGSYKELAYYSTGYKDIIGICTRFALADALFEEEKPFLILDDPFVNLDEEKIKKAGVMLEEIAKTYQMIYFTCHESRE